MKMNDREEENDGEVTVEITEAKTHTKFICINILGEETWRTKEKKKIRA